MNIFDKCIYLHKSIELDKKEILRLKELATEIPAADPAKEFVGGGFTSGSRFSGLIDKALDLADELAKSVEEKLDYEKEIYSLIEQVNPQEGLVLRMFYIDGMEIEDIADALGLTTRRIYDIKSKAIKKCEEFRSISQ